MSAKQILVVDDNQLVVIAVSALVNKCGHVPTTASSGAVAMRHLCDRTYDLVITDNCMPLPGDGIELIQFITRKHGKDVPIILHTADVPHDLPTLREVFPHVSVVIKTSDTPSELERVIQEKLSA